MRHIDQRIALGILEQRIGHDEEAELLEGLVEQVGVAAPVLLAAAGEESGLGQLLFEFTQLDGSHLVRVGHEVNGFVDDAVAAVRLWAALQFQADLGCRVQLFGRPEKDNVRLKLPIQIYFHQLFIYFDSVLQ